MSSGRLNDLLTTKQQQDEDEGIKQNLFVLVEDVSTKLDDSHNSFNISVLWQIIPVSICKYYNLQFNLLSLFVVLLQIFSIFVRYVFRYNARMAIADISEIVTRRHTDTNNIRSNSNDCRISDVR